MNSFLSSQGYSIFKRDLTEEQLNKIKTDLNVSPFVPLDFDFIPVSSFKLYSETENKIYLPKNYGLKNFGIPSIDRTPCGKKINLEFVGSLRDEQKEPVQAFLNSCYDPLKRGGILNLRCAFGKTTLALYIICKLSVKTLIVVHKDFLLQQWKERIEQFIPNARIGIIKAKIFDIEDKDIVLASLQSLSMKTYDKSLFDCFGFSCFDECHHTSAEVFSKALKKFATKYTLGLSATIKRKDGLSKVFLWYLGDVVFTNCKNKEGDDVQVLYKKFYDPNPVYSREQYMMGTKLNISKMVNNITEFKKRTDFIVKEITTILNDELTRKLIILSDRKSLLIDLFNQLNKNYKCGYYLGGMKQEELKKSEDCQILLATFSMASEGFDVKSLDTLVLATPKSDVVQSVGRILRELPENRKNIPLILDIVDDFSLFSKQAEKRLTYYKKCKYHIDGDIQNNRDKHKLITLTGCQIKNLEEN